MGKWGGRGVKGEVGGDFDGAEGTAYDYGVEGICFGAGGDFVGVVRGMVDLPAEFDELVQPRDGGDVGAGEEAAGDGEVIEGLLPFFPTVFEGLPFNGPLFRYPRRGSRGGVEIHPRNRSGQPECARGDVRRRVGLQVFVDVLCLRKRRYL